MTIGLDPNKGCLAQETVPVSELLFVSSCLFVCCCFFVFLNNISVVNIAINKNV